METTYLPDHVDELRRLYDFLLRQGPLREGAPRYRLTAPDGDAVEVPEEAHRLIRHAVEVLRAGRAVSLVPIDLNCTWSQAASLLGVSESELDRLVEQQRLPATRLNSGWQLDLRDVLAYQEQRRRERSDKLFADAREEVGEGDLADGRRIVEETRAAVAAEWRERSVE